MGCRSRFRLTLLILCVAVAGVTRPAAATGFGSAQPAFLPGDQAFQPDAWLEDGMLTVAWRIAPGYYLYNHALAVSANGEAVSVDWPAGEAYHDEHFGAVTIYRDQLFAAAAAPEGVDTVTVEYQGCADAGLCYPPMSVTLPLAVD